MVVFPAPVEPEAVDEVGDGGLPRAGGAHEGDLLARLGVEAHVVEDGFAFHIGEVHPVEPHVAGQGGVGDGAVVVGMLPGPHVGPLLALGEVAVGALLGVDQGDVALIRLRLLVDEIEDPLGAGQTHDHGVDLVGHLADVAGELLGHVEEGHHDADAEGQTREADVGGAGEQQGAAHQGHDDVEHVADVVEDGHESIGVAVGPAGVFKEVVVDLVEVGHGLLLVAEDLDDLLAVHHLLHEALRAAQGLLLANEVPGGAAAHLPHHQDHHKGAQQHHQGHPQAVVEHDAQDRQRHHSGDHQLGEALGDHLAQGVDVVGVVAHDIAVVMGIEVADGEVLHAVEHLFPEFGQGTLGDDSHHLAEGKAGNKTDEIEDDQQTHQGKDAPGGGGPVSALPAFLHYRQHILKEKGGQGADDSIEQNAGDGHRQQHRIELKKGANQASHDAFGLGTGRSGVMRHRDHLPCSERCRPPGKFRWSSKVPRGCPQR